MRTYTIPINRVVWRLYREDGIETTNIRAHVRWFCEAVPTTKEVTYTEKEVIHPLDRDALYRALVQAHGHIKETHHHYYGFSLPSSATPWSWILVHRSMLMIIDPIKDNL